WNLDHIPGGSSSGSRAALAAGLVMGATGSDTGGSIRGPAAFCGIVGLKPTYGRVSRAGVLTLSWTLDHAGPVARTVEDCAYLLQAMAGHDAADPAASRVPVDDYLAPLGRDLRGVKVGVPRSYFLRAWIQRGHGRSREHTRRCVNSAPWYATSRSPASTRRQRSCSSSWPRPLPTTSVISVSTQSATARCCVSVSSLGPW